MPASTRLDLKARLERADPRKRGADGPHSSLVIRFRPATSLKEMRALLHIRYWGFGASALQMVVHDSQDEMDLDCYDGRSLHYGVYAMIEGQELPVGYIRSVGLEPTEHTPFIEAITASADDLRDNAKSSEARPLPTLEYLPEPNLSAVQALVVQTLEGGQVIAEGSRFSLSTEFRSLGTAKFIIQCLCADALFRRNVDIGYATTAVTQARFYLGLGFHRLPDSTDIYIPKLEMKGCSLQIVRSELPPELFATYTAIATELDDTGFVERTFPFHGPSHHSNTDSPQES